MTSLELNAQALNLGQDDTADGAAFGFDTAESKARRALNVVVACLGLLIVSPILIGVALLVKLTSPGPILYRQVRVGRDRRSPHLPMGNHRRVIDFGGSPFTIYKFRTMAVTSARTERQVWASQNDSRVTSLGRFLRRSRLDELPQLFNVLKGDMNIVGPRPEQPNIFASLRGQVSQYGERQRVRPGITGWAQINLHYDRDVEDVKRKVALDLEYIARQSFMEDLKIMLGTLPVMVFKKGGW